MHSCYTAVALQDEEQLKLSAQQTALLKQQLDDSQAHAAAAERRVQHTEGQTQMLEGRVASLQTQGQELQAQTR